MSSRSQMTAAELVMLIRHEADGQFTLGFSEACELVTTHTQLAAANAKLEAVKEAHEITMAILDKEPA